MVVEGSLDREVKGYREESPYPDGGEELAAAVFTKETKPVRFIELCKKLWNWRGS